MEPAPYDITIWVQGTYRKNMVYLQGGIGSDPVNLTGYGAQFSIYLPLSSDPVYTMTDVSGGITLGGTAGTINLFIDESDTESFEDWVVQRGQLPQYVLYLTPLNGDSDPLLTGNVVLRGTFQ